MYYQLISQCTQALKNLETWLDKAEQHAAARKFDVGVLMTSRLAPDMKDFIYQVQSACDYVKGAAAWLSGQTPPRNADTEKTVDDLRARSATRRLMVDRFGRTPRTRFSTRSQPAAAESARPPRSRPPG